MPFTLPSELTNLRQFCCRVGKRPYVRGDSGRLSPSWKNQSGWLTFAEAMQFVEKSATVAYKIDDDCYEDRIVEGIGYLNSKSEDPSKQIVGGDLDACRDPETGKLGAWATKFLEDTKPFYVEVSPSRCGMRFFYLAHLPNRVNSLFANGPQDDLSDETKERILKVKEVRSGWNGLELYEADRHLTITGIDQKYSEVVDRSGLLMAALVGLNVQNGKSSKPKQSPQETFSDIPDWVSEMEKNVAENRFPKLTMRDVIDLSEFHYEGEQLAGSHPMGSQSGHNVLITPDESRYCWMHNNIKTGGDAWVWLAHECGAAPWEMPGEGLLRDQVIREKTLAYAIKRNLIKKEDVPAHTPLEAYLSLDDVSIVQGDGDKAFHKFSPTKATTSLLKVLKLAKARGGDSRDPIYYYNGQIFVPDGERIINNILNKAGGDLASIKNKKETVSRLHDLLLSYAVVFDNDPFLLGVRNGVVNMKTGEYRQYLPDDFITDQIQVTYDKDATCPKFIKFLKEVAPNDIDQCTLVDWFAIHSIKLMFPYIMFLNGLGRNGKGIYERVMKRFYGEDAFCGMALEELTLKNNRFAGAELAGKRGQIVSEAGEEQHRGKRKIPTSFMKNSTGDGIIDSDRKNKNRIKFKPFHATTVDSNDMPLIDDMSKGWIERFCKVDMPFHYVDNPDPANQMERQKDPHLFEKLTTEEELSGILNLLIERTIKLSQTMTITKRPGEEMFAEYKKQSNSISTFLEAYCDYDLMGGAGKDVFLDTVYDAYKTWCEIVVCDKVDVFRFGAAVKKLCDNHPPERIHEGDHKRRIYRGFRFNANRYQALLDQYKTINGPLKTVTGPIGPLNTHNLSAIEENIHIEKKKQDLPQKADSGPDSDCKNMLVHDSDCNGAKNEHMGLISIVKKDLVPVHFLMDYNQYRKDDVASMPTGIARELDGMRIVTVVIPEKAYL
jgi:P4 family phage/plasmid primase-like protien